MTTTASNESHAYSDLKKPDTAARTHIDPGVEEFANQYWLADFSHPNKLDWWQYQDNLNNGYCNGGWWNDGYYTALKNYDFLAAFSSDLNLTCDEYKRAQAYFSTLNLEKFGVAKEYVAHALCSYVIEMDERDQRRGQPQSNDRDVSLIELQETIGLRQSQLLSLYGKVAHHLRRTSVDDVSTFQELQNTLGVGGDGSYQPDSSNEATRIPFDW